MEPPIPVENRANLGSLEFARLADDLSGHRSIKLAVDWLSTLNPPLVPSEIVTQDEYTHDILVPFRDGCWLVYGCT